MKLSKHDLKLAKCALARKSFYFYCCLIVPKIFTKNHWHLKEWAESIVNFFFGSNKTFWMLNAPPRHGKSLILQLFCSWLLGNNPKLRILILAYNASFAEIFGKKVRNIIQQEASDNDDIITFADIFPGVCIKQGDGASDKWRVEGSDEISFFCASLGTSITGAGFDIVCLDDMIKNSTEAHNSRYLNQIYTDFTDTVLSRIEGTECKIFITMTRWAMQDICGKLINDEDIREDMELLTYKAKLEDGSWIAEDMIARGGKFLNKMSTDIFLANYQQTPIDITNRLYSDGFKTWNSNDLPKFDSNGREMMYQTEVMVDSADKGKDYLCAIFYVPWKNKIFVQDIIYTQLPMSKTEQMLLDSIIKNKTVSYICEGNNGGSIFTSNIEKEYKRKGLNKCRFSCYNQTKNKESRILARAGWCQENIYMPEFWDKSYPDFYRDIMSFQSDFKSNIHDDSADCLSSIADRYDATNKKGITIVR